MPKNKVFPAVCVAARVMFFAAAALLVNYIIIQMKRAVSVLVLLAELVFSRLEYRILDNVPEINLYMEYSDKDCLENVLQLLRQNRLSISNMEITRSAGSEEHNACAIFALHLKKGCRTEDLIQKIQRIEGVVSVEEI